MNGSGVSSNVLATLIGVFLALWFDRRAERRAEDKERKAERLAISDALSGIARAIEANENLLKRLRETLHRHPFPYDVVLHDEAWSAVQPVLTSQLREPETRQRLAYYFTRVATVRRLIDVALTSSPDVRYGLMQDAGSIVSEVLEEGRELIEQAHRIRESLGKRN